MAQSYFVAGEAEQGISSARAFGERALGISGSSNPDVIVLRYGLFSVEDARKLIDAAYRSASGDSGKLIIASAPRLFHEAQNALLKVFEEPPEGVTLVLVVPSVGILLPTLRSRLLPLPAMENKNGELTPIARSFIEASSNEREKLIEKLLDKAKSDKDDVKQSARAEAVGLLEGLMRAGYAQLRLLGTGSEAEEYRLFLNDLSRFLPILHERSAPLKQIFEHLLMVVPRKLQVHEV